MLPTESRTLTARVGQWCYHHRWTVIAVWITVVVAGVLAAGPVFNRLGDDNGPAALESVQADTRVAAADTSSGTIVGVITGVDPAAPAVRAQAATVAAQLRRVSGVTAVTTATNPNAHNMLVRATLGNLTDAATESTTGTISTDLHAIVPPLRAAGWPDANMLVGGGPVLGDQTDDQAQKDLSGAEELSLPITLLILVVVFGGLIAAALPVLSAVVSIAGSMGVLLAFSHVTKLDSDAVTVITLLGLGLSIDYGLLLVARYREELAAGFEPVDAVQRAWASAGRTIVFSALTVAASLSGMLVFGITSLSALGAAGVSITVVAMFTALTLTAAMLGLAGRRVRPRAKRRRNAGAGADDERGFFAGLARTVQRRPLVTALGTAVVLLGLGLPVLTMSVRLDNVDGVPRSLESVRAMDVLAADYGDPIAVPITVVAATDASRLDSWAAGVAHLPGITQVERATQLRSGLATVDIETSGGPEGATARKVVALLRTHRPPGVQSWVTGDAARHVDIVAQIEDRLPYAVGLTLLAMIVLLFAMTGSLVVPLKAVVMNLVSLAATFGIMTAVFERGFLAGPLHTLTVSGMSPYVVVTVFAFAFGLSMDYEVFMLARIKEQVDRGARTDAAVRRGLQRSGRIITSAGLLMVVVFSCFLVGRIGNVQQIGLGLAVAIAIDATLVRCVLVPATMTLLGRANWWAPAWLARLRTRAGLDRRLAESPEPAEQPQLASVGG